MEIMYITNYTGIKFNTHSGITKSRGLYNEETKEY